MTEAKATLRDNTTSGAFDIGTKRVKNPVSEAISGEHAEIEKLYDDIEHGVEIYMEQGSQAAMNFLNAVRVNESLVAVKPPPSACRLHVSAGFN